MQLCKLRVFLFCSQPAADMPLILVFVQNLPHLQAKYAIILHEPDGNVFMYGRR